MAATSATKPAVIPAATPPPDPDDTYASVYGRIVVLVFARFEIAGVVKKSIPVTRLLLDVRTQPLLHTTSATAAFYRFGSSLTFPTDLKRADWNP
jgi:hypothetical protein